MNGRILFAGLLMCGICGPCRGVPVVRPTVPSARPEQLLTHISEQYHDPAVRAFLDTIAYAEDTYRLSLLGYSIRYPNKFFTSLQDHPRKISCAQLNGKRVCAAAAGRYQILLRTWREVQGKLEFPDFGPKSQDLAAIYLIYRRKALADVKALNVSPLHWSDSVKKRFRDVVRKLNREWATFPESPYGQQARTFDQMEAMFKKRLAYHQQRLNPYHISGGRVSS